MDFYKIRDKLTPCEYDEILSGNAQYVAVLTSEEWKSQSEKFGMYIDIDLDTADTQSTAAFINYDSLTGSFCIPDRENITGISHFFRFALDEKGIVLIDDEKYASLLVEKIQKTKGWKLPSLERFLYDLLEMIIASDLSVLERMEHTLIKLEEDIIQKAIEQYPVELNDVRGDLLDLRVHYEQLIDMGRELEENENNFFKTENLRFFRLFTERVERLQDMVTSLRDYTVQIRDLVQSQLSIRQNRIMTHLTVVTTIFLPLNLIVGWYGMNFRYMPELEWGHSYLVVIILSVVIIVGCLVYFKKKRWM